MRDVDEKPRCMNGPSGHLKPEEVAFVRSGFELGRRASAVAVDLDCSVIAIRRRYRKLREEREEQRKQA